MAPGPSPAWNTTIGSMVKQPHNDLIAIIEARDASSIGVWRWDGLKLRLGADAEEQLTRSMKRLQAERREKLAAGEARPSELV